MSTSIQLLRSRLPLAAVLLALVPIRPASAIVFQNTSAQTAGLGASQGFLDGEAELIINLSNSTTVGCSGSLIDGGQYILTAAHCVTGDTDSTSATSISINFANVGLNLTSTSYVVDPTWNGSLTSGGDLALVKLSTPVTSIASYGLNTKSSAVGDVVTLAGYGYTGTGSAGYTANTFGTLYYGTNQYIGVYSNVTSVYGYGFTSGGGTIGSTEVMVAPGDSGGAALIDVGGTWDIVGVHDFVSCVTTGCTPNSSFGQYGGDTSVYADAAFIDSVLPEPASLTMLAIALSGLAATSRRRSAESRQPAART